ncbi:unnamed protein product [Penicillium olsonii]|uniref:Cytochrome c oxidase subunit 3 n=1 Tax=Penicillium olsonii TaxID=99116 RepID=A0A9W4N010_PENOL|nr:unnamed protein product [Penicillium olsonii]CAG7933610.1 unnamed protein product [Penicillium olsonii]CAG8170043.1 unnamed protein product [Penicillium olsonii]CAG8215458.1 unnamed protein product [Penicillium olsonii]CAG8293944.1 unnamed protein product [Penicillium olsonii]
MNNIFLLNDSITNGFRIEFVDTIYLVSTLLGLLTIVSRNPVVSVLFLIGLFVNVAGLLILIGYNFIGLAYILVYVGAVSILFLFILMLINIRVSELFTDTNNDLPLAILTVIIFYYIMGQVLPSNFTENSIVSYLSNSFSDVYNVQLDNELFNIVDLKQQIGYASILFMHGFQGFQYLVPLAVFNVMYVMGIQAVNPFELPLLNTILLLSSGVTITYAHHSLIQGNRKGALYGTVVTIILAVVFTFFQGVEYSVSSFTISDSVYGSCFYFGTGFHGIHVMVGTAFLAVGL